MVENRKEVRVAQTKYSKRKMMREIRSEVERGWMLDDTQDFTLNVTENLWVLFYFVVYIQGIVLLICF